MIQVNSISKAWLNRTVLHGVSFSLKPGKSFVILGQSGIGKSVLLKILAGLITPDTGAVQIRSHNIGMLFQRNALFDSFSVEENLEFPLKERTTLTKIERKKRILKFLEWVELSQCEHLFPHELSGGMQKRLGIARALIVEPEVIFYDEPTAGLDPITSRTIADLILRLKKEMASTLVCVTSDVLRAFQLADSIGLLIRSSQGARLTLAGTPEEAGRSTDPSLQQFLRGLTHGPLTNSI